MNKFIFITLFLVENVFSVCLAQSYPYQKESIPVPQRVKDLLSRMTLEEKIAELNTLLYERRLHLPVSDTCRESRRFFESEWSGTKPFSTRGSSET